MMYIARLITEAQIHRLHREREYAYATKNYERAWVLDVQINKHKNRLISLSC